MAAGVVTVRRLSVLAGAAALVLSSHIPPIQAQSARLDAAAIIQSFAATGRIDFRFQSIEDANAFVDAWAAGVERWTAVGPEADTERRSHLAALAALEFARAGFDALGPPFRKSELQYRLIEAAHSRLRQSSPSEFERRWLIASTGFATGLANVGGQFSEHLVRALARFPRDPRLRLNRMLLDRDVITLATIPGTSQADLALSLGHGDRDASLRDLRQQRVVGRAESVFADLLSDPDVGAEASARLGWLRFHQNDTPGSLALFSRAGSEAREPYVASLAALGLGLAHLAAGSADDATAAFRTAVTALPTARAATTALAMQLFLAGRRREASDLLDDLSGVPNSLDPWTHVAAADRLMGGVIDSLRSDLGVPATRAVSGGSPGRSETPAAPASPIAATSRIDRVETTRRPDFASVTSIVSVDVAVSSGRRPIAGLIANDFELRDNGVVQAIESVSIEGLAIDLTIVLDLRDMGYGLSADKRTVSVMDATKQGVLDTAHIRALLGPNDRLRVITATREVNEPFPLQGPGGSARYVVQREMAPAAALHDAVFTALARTAATDRRHLILVFTDGVDGASIITSEQLRRAAAQGDALVQVIRRDTADEFFRREGMKQSPGLSRYLLRPHDTRVLPAVAEATGGSVERVRSTGESVVEEVKRTLETFRQRYVLKYRPAGVEAGGWHNITVRVTRSGSLTVQARRGYFGG